MGAEHINAEKQKIGYNWLDIKPNKNNLTMLKVLEPMGREWVWNKTEHIRQNSYFK